MNERHIPKSAKVVLVYVLAILLEFTIVNAYLASAITISSGVWSGAPSYTVWKDGSTYYAKNAWGQTPFSGTNGTAVFEDIAANGGEIYVTAGTFLARIILLSNTWLHGEGTKTIIKPDGASSSYNNATIRISGSNVTVSNLVVNGLGTTQTLGIWKGTGIEIDGYNAARDNILIEESVISHTANHGIFGWGKNYEISNVVIRRCDISRTGNNSGAVVGTHGYGIWFSTRFSNIRAEDNSVHDTDGGVGIGFGNDASFKPHDVQIRGNHLNNNKRYAIDVSSASHFIVENNFIDNSNTAILDENSYGIFFEAISPQANMSVIKNNYLRRQGVLDIFIRAPTSNLIVDGNTMSEMANATGTPIHLEIGTFSGLVCENITITNNIIEGSNDAGTTDGLWLYLNSGTMRNFLVINNIISNVDDGIYIGEVTDVIVMGNLLRFNNVGVREDGACDYNIFIGNNMRGSTTNATIVGANDIFEHNLP